MSKFHVRTLLLVLLPLSLALGCTPDDDDDSNPLPAEVIWEEDSDDDNGFPTDAEPVDVGWTNTLIIEGSMSDCGYDNDEDWPWTGDEDNYRIEVPADGYIDVLLTWDTDSDLDMLVYFEPPTSSLGGISPDALLTSSSDGGEIEFIFEDEYERGDDFVLAVLCAWGEEGDYALEVHWES